MPTAVRTTTEPAPAPLDVGAARVEVTTADGRARVHTRASSSVRPMLLEVSGTSARVALMPVSATLLAGDAVAIEVSVGAGASLRVVEPTGTVAYDMRGASATWSVSVAVGADARLTWWGEPFVVATGAEVERTTTIRLDEGASMLWRETIVLGRGGEIGGALRARTDVVDGLGRPVLVEEQVYAPAAQVPGRLGPHRVVDTVVSFGPGPDADTARTWPSPLPDACRFTLASGDRMGRWLGPALHASPYER